MVTAPFRGASGKRYVYSLLPDNQEMGVPQQGGERKPRRYAALPSP